MVCDTAARGIRIDEVDYHPGFPSQSRLPELARGTRSHLARSGKVEASAVEVLKQAEERLARWAHFHGGRGQLEADDRLDSFLGGPGLG